MHLSLWIQETVSEQVPKIKLGPGNRIMLLFLGLGNDILAGRNMIFKELGAI